MTQTLYDYDIAHFPDTLDAVDPDRQPLVASYAGSEGSGIQAAGYDQVRAALRLDERVPVTGVDERQDFHNETIRTRADQVRAFIEQRRARIACAVGTGVIDRVNQLGL